MRYVRLMSDDQLASAPDAVPETVESSDVPTSPRGRPGWLFPAGMAVLGIVLGIGGTLAVQAVLGGGTAAPEEDVRLSDAYSSCGSPVGITLADENRTLTIDVRGDEDSNGATYEAQACILRSLDTPSSVIAHLEQTTSMDGRQTESWNGITAAWSYHPDRGSDMVITLDPTD